MPFWVFKTCVHTGELVTCSSTTHPWKAGLRTSTFFCFLWLLLLFEGRKGYSFRYECVCICRHASVTVWRPPFYARQCWSIIVRARGGWKPAASRPRRTEAGEGLLGLDPVSYFHASFAKLPQWSKSESRRLFQTPEPQRMWTHSSVLLTLMCSKLSFYGVISGPKHPYTFMRSSSSISHIIIWSLHLCLHHCLIHKHYSLALISCRGNIWKKKMSLTVHCSPWNINL